MNSCMPRARIATRYRCKVYHVRLCTHDSCDLLLKILTEIHVESQCFLLLFLRQGVPNIGDKSGVSGRTRLLPGTLAHALVVLHNALPTGHETSHDG